MSETVLELASKLKCPAIGKPAIARTLALFVALTAVIICLPKAAAAEKIKLALNWKPEPQFGGFYAAQISGAFAKNGLDVEIMPGGSGTPTVQMVASGTVDFAIVSADEAVINRARGGKVVALFAAYQTNPQGIMAHAERGFKSMHDVFAADGVLAAQRGLTYFEFLERKFSSIGNKINVKIVPDIGGIANFIHDPKYSQQCFIASEPLEAKKAGVAVTTFLVANEGYNPYTTVLVTRAEIMANKPGLARALVTAVRDGWREYLDHPDATNRMMGRLNKSMSAESFNASALAQKPLIETAATRKSGLGSMTEERWRDLARQLKELKVIDKEPTAKDLFVNL